MSAVQTMLFEAGKLCLYICNASSQSQSLLLEPFSSTNACRGSDCALNGCINDAHCMAFLLTSKFGFRQENMRMLLDDNPNFNERPTRQNMMQGFQWLIAGCQPGDSLFFHYSGGSSSCSLALPMPMLYCGFFTTCNQPNSQLFDTSERRQICDETRHIVDPKGIFGDSLEPAKLERTGLPSRSIGK